MNLAKISGVSSPASANGAGGAGGGANGGGSSGGEKCKDFIDVKVKVVSTQLTQNGNFYFNHYKIQVDIFFYFSLVTFKRFNQP